MDDRLSRLQLQPMEYEHVEALAAIEEECFSDPWSKEGLMEELDNPLAVFRVAVDGEVPVGYIGMHHIIDEGYITNVAVTEAYRQQGIGTLLLKSLIRYAKENDLTMLTLEVRRSNEAAIALYEKCGFDEEGERKDFYVNPTEDALILTRRF